MRLTRRRALGLIGTGAAVPLLGSCAADERLGRGDGGGSLPGHDSTLDMGVQLPVAFRVLNLRAWVHLPVVN